MPQASRLDGQDWLRSRLLRGASVFVLASSLGWGQARAQSVAALLHAAHAQSASAGVPTVVAPQVTIGGSGAQMNAASVRALTDQAAVSQALSMASQAQAAARTAAAAVNPGVPDGLTAGGLTPVTNMLSAAADPTGLSTWQGASAPTQAQSGGQVTVTIDQTDPRALLSWTTFNVGANTTLVFNQAQGGQAQSDWVVLNRVVGQIDPATGLRDPGAAPAPSQILGQIKAQGEVLILNPNGVLFGPNSQVNTHALVATSLDIGQGLSTSSTPVTIQQRNETFLTYGVLGAQEALNTGFTFSAEAISSTQDDPTLEGAVTVEAGAQISTDPSGFVLLLAPNVTNSGLLSSPDGQVTLQSGRYVTLQASDGSATAVDPNVRGLVVTSLNKFGIAGDYVQNTPSGVIEAGDGYVSLGATSSGAVIDQGVITSSTSVSRNGFVELSGGDIRIGGTISIGPDDSAGALPQDPASLGAFKSSQVAIGDAQSRIEIDSGTLIYAPSANVAIGASAGPTTTQDVTAIGDSRIFIDGGAVIDVGGLKDVEIAASRNQILIDPVKQNELADDPNYKSSFLNGAGVYVDPRLSGVSADGVAWVGSPLIDAASYAQQVGVSASELMTTGGNVTLGVASFTPRANTSTAPDVTVKAGATIDISGGWVTYQAGMVRTTQLIDASGQVVDISNANPNDTYVGIYNGFTASEPRWGISQSFGDPLLLGERYVPQYSEGRDAGSLTIQSSVVAFDGTVYGQVFAGPAQIAGATPGTASSSIYGDQRLLQGAPSQLPSGGFLFVQASGADNQGNLTGGADIKLTAQAPAPVTVDYGQGVSVDPSGELLVPTRDPASLLPADRLDAIQLSAPALSGMGLSDISLQTSGKITVDPGASVMLEPGGVFNALAGRTLTLDGSITAPSGTISLATAELLPGGSALVPDTPTLGSYDLVINGTLSTRGRWINDFNQAPDDLQGTAFLNGGSISLTAAPRVSSSSQTATLAATLAGQAPTTTQDISGSILVNSGALLDVSSGGYVSEKGALQLTARGGDLTLTEQTTYFDLVEDSTVDSGGIPGFRVSDILNANTGVAYVPVNPSQINVKVQIAPGTILADGFGGGGTFTLTTPAFSFGDQPAQVGTALPLDFFNRTGFANYVINSYKTALIPNVFANGLGGYDALLQTQVVDVGAGQTLNLTQSGFTPQALLTTAQTASLRGLATGGDLYSVLSPITPADTWDQLPVNLTLGGLIELDIAPGGQVTGAPGAGLTVSQLVNGGLIRLPGGTLTQSEVLPALYASIGTVGAPSLDDVFSQGPGGQTAETGPNLLGITGSNNQVLTNAQLAAQAPIYLTGNLDQGVGMALEPGSVTDLSGEAVLNPRANLVGQPPNAEALAGKVVAGGAIVSLSPSNTGANVIAPLGSPSVVKSSAIGERVSDIVYANGAVIDVSGSSATFEERTASGQYAPTPAWSNGGTLYFGGGVELQNVDLDAAGGAPSALGGALTVPNLVLTQAEPPAGQPNTLSANMIQGAGIATVVAQGSLTGEGDVKLSLANGFFLTSTPYGDGVPGQNLTSATVRDSMAPVVSASGALEIDAPYIGFDSSFQTVSGPAGGTPGAGSATFKAGAIDVMGAVRFDQSLATVNLDSTNDLRLIGIEPWQQVFGVNGGSEPNSLVGQLSVDGDLNITAAQVYPTTGSTFYVSSAAANGTITIARTPGSSASAPYSAGGALTIQAANIVQGGIVRAPLGALTLGADTPLTIATDGVPSAAFAPATASVTLTSGSQTSVSAAGLSIPYGTTTDQTEWFFTPTNSSELTAPPAGVLTLAGQQVSVGSGATVDLRGGGDVYAYEFIPGVGGSRDVLSQLNPDSFTSNNGFQYPDQRQVYAIVPGLTDPTVAAYDPIYSANYGNLYGPQGAGMSVYLNGGPNIAAGWYTLLPAQYAMLPGGLRLVQDTSAAAPSPASGQTLADGTVVVSGEYGDPNAKTISSTVSLFDVQSQSTFLKYSDIALTSGDATFAADAANNGVVTPRLPIDAGRLVLNPVDGLAIQSAILTAPASGGRGSDIDIGGVKIEITDQPQLALGPGVIDLTVPELTQLDAASLLIGGQRTDNSDGTTNLGVTAQSITVANSAGDPLSAPEVMLAVDGAKSSISVLPGASIQASGVLDVGQTGDLVIDGSAGLTGQGAVLRVADGAQRLLTRESVNIKIKPGTLTLGAGAAVGGQSVLLDASGAMSIDPAAKLQATSLAIDAASMAFTATPQKGVLSFGPSLITQLSAAKTLVLRSPGVISFDPGSYGFGDLTLDTPGLALNGAGQVNLSAGVLSLANSSAQGARCSTALTCKGGQLAINATEIDFSSGTLTTYGFGGLVSLTAPAGIYAVGTGGLDVGPAALEIQTPFIGDKASPATTRSTTAASVGLTLTADAEVIISNPAAAAIPTVDGAPGASITIDGASISVSGVELRATAGELALQASQGDIVVSGGAVLETPGYSKSFGDAADPYSITAPGGRLSLTALAGDIDAASGTTLSVGGGTGQAGQLSLVASGAVDLNGTLDATAPSGGAGFTLNTGQGFDLTGFETRWGSAFDGAVSIRTGAGGLALASGLDLKATSVALTADGGLVDISGEIDVSGINGGAVSLTGAQGVTLESGSTIDAHADGYGATDTRQATGGAVTLGTAGSGVIDVAAGATIDLSAHRPGDRLVPMSRDGEPDFTYVQGDQGGTLMIRAPVITSGGTESVNVAFAGTLAGASGGSPGAVSSVVLEAYRPFDLGAVAASGGFVGVTQTSPGLITLDTTATGLKPNFLADKAPGTIVDFVQSFDLSAANANLGELAALPVFHARPGVELDYSGSIVLASNWNLGAGTVNVAGAVAAGLMAADPQLPGKYYVIPGDEGAVFSQYTTLTYRVGGSVSGEPGDLSIRAAGGLTLDGSLTDGFFTFADQTDPGYVSLALGGGSRTYQAQMSPSCPTADCSTVAAFTPAAQGSDFVLIQFPNLTSMPASFFNPVPYDAAANLPGAVGSMAGGTGDPIGSAELFPLINVGGATRPVSSWSYRLVAGAGPSADPAYTAIGSTANLVVQGDHPYTLSATAPSSSFTSALELQAGTQFVSAADWLAAFLSANPTLTPDSDAVIDFSIAPGASARPALQQDAIKFSEDLSNVGKVRLLGPQPTTRPTGFETTLQIAAEFMAGDKSLAGSFKYNTLKSDWRTPSTHALPSLTAYAPTLIRTGTGDIQLAAAGTVDLSNDATPLYLNGFGKTVKSNAAGAEQLGGVAVYTAGHVVDLSSPTAMSGGQGYLDTSASGAQTNVFDQSLSYAYGAGASQPGGDGLPGVMIANPVYAEGGGGITVTAGQDVLGRRDLWLENTVDTAYNTLSGAGYAWIGDGDQPWRSGVVGQVTDIRTDPQLFQEGLGALAGGDVTVTAGRNVSDISVVDTTSVATAQIEATPGSASSGQALMTFGGGDVTVEAAGRLLGGRVYVGSGQGAIGVGGNVESGGMIGPVGQQVPDPLVLRLSDATIDVEAGGSVEIAGVAALGVRGSSSQVQGSLNAMGFYSQDAGVSILADGPVSIDNAGASVLTPSSAADNDQQIAVYPGSLQAASLNGNLSIATPGQNGVANFVELYPSAAGQLTLAAAGDISATTIDMDDGDPNQLPGLFTNFQATVQGAAGGSRGFLFPGVLSTTTEATLRTYHNASPTHLDDPVPNRIYAGQDILDMILSTPKQTRIGAGRDIVNMMFFGQNLQASDITRITAGRDIIGTTELANPLISLPNTFGEPLPALQGNTFVIGGPGSFFLEAGRDLGPFLNSAVTPGFLHDSAVPAETLTYGGGVLSVGNDWNPWLQPVGASIYTEFGVAKGQDFDALREDYLDPANLSSMPDYLFVQTTSAEGVVSTDRSKPIYAPVLIAWMQANQSQLLTAQFGTTSVTYQQAYSAFASLSGLTQRSFLLKDVYFNELEQPSIPGPSFHVYTRGYEAVNTLFPASLGYTSNDLSGASNGSADPIQTGDLDLRLATIQTDWGGDIFILGPGGRVLGGSTVRTADQAARRAYIGGQLFEGSGGQLGNLTPEPASISAIPVGDEGVLTLQGGGIYTFTDQDFLLNQSRLFTEEGGDIVMWSSNGNLNAGQGPKTTPDIPPVQVKIDENAISQIDQDSAVSGAGIGAFQPNPNGPAPSVFLLAPAGTVDAGAAGVRVAGDLYVAAQSVANADNFKVSGVSIGLPVSGTVNVGAQTSAAAAAAQAAQVAQSAANVGNQGTERSIITVNVDGYAGDAPCPPDDKTCKPKSP